jgi:uncharacterized repeat protein (TIGR01451 family)
VTSFAVTSWNKDGVAGLAIGEQGENQGVVVAMESALNQKLYSSAPALNITKSHTGNFTPGQQGATYTITVSNAANAAPVAGNVTVTDTVPAGLTLVSMTGNNWTCAANACTRNDALTGGLSYDAITVAVNVSASATSPQVNMASVSGGGSVSASASDTTTIGANSTPAFFDGSVSVGDGLEYLRFPDGTLFGYYTFLTGAWIYHVDMGYEYVIPGAGTQVFLWDLASTHWLYTDASTFPYLYDFTLNAWLYYFPNTQSAGHYTTNPRYFSNLTTGKIITM